jgi:hypothetical protein
MPPKGSKVGHRNMGTRACPPTTEVGQPRRPAMGTQGGGAFVVVRARESRVHGEGGQQVGTLSRPDERSMDLDHRVDRAWVLDVQRKVYQWSREHPDDVYRELWKRVTDPRNLPCAWRRVTTNEGSRTPGCRRDDDGESPLTRGVPRSGDSSPLTKTTRRRHDLWRAGCIAKGARPVRRGAMGNRRRQRRTAPMSYPACAMKARSKYRCRTHHADDRPVTEMSPHSREELG